MCDECKLLTAVSNATFKPLPGQQEIPVKPVLAELLARSGERKPTTKRRRRPCGLTVEPLEAREVPVVGAFAIPDPVEPEDGFAGVIKVVSPLGHRCSGTLLSTGRHVLTAAHCVDFNVDSDGDGHADRGDGVIDPGNYQVIFELPIAGGVTNAVFVTAANIATPAGWTGDWRDHDIAVLELPSMAHPEAQRSEIFRGSNEIGQVFTMVGYGRTGTGETGHTESSGTKRLGQNRFDAVSGTTLEYDFDDGTSGDSLGANEAMQGPGDSGGPCFLGNQIAGVVSFGTAGSKFGSIGNVTRVSQFADFIDAQTDDFVFDMNAQADGNDGIRDRIEVQVSSATLHLNIWVNGMLRVSQSVANISSLAILGSVDSEDITIGPMGMEVNVHHGGSSDATAQSLTVRGTKGTDRVRIDPGMVTLNGRTITHDGVQVIVSTLAGKDTIMLGHLGDLPANADVLVFGGDDSDTLEGPQEANLWDITEANGGTLNSGIRFSSMERLQGGIAADIFWFGIRASMSGTVHGGGGVNTLNYAGFASAITINLQLSTAPGLAAFSAITQVVGGRSAADVLIGSNRTTTWNLTGSDEGQVSSGTSAMSFSGFENLRGGTAADTFRMFNGGSISGALDGGSGMTITGLAIDTLDYSRRTSGVVVDLTSGLIPGAGSARNMEQVIGSPKDDLLRGDARSNILVGGGGFDILVGEDGNDQLIAGNTGRCILIGGRGKDMLVGGDPFVFQPSPLDPLPGRTGPLDGSDLLIGGRTVFDGNHQALNAIMTEWRRSNRTYAQRVQALRDGVPVEAGGLVQLTTATVQDDGIADQLGGKGGDDWFWATALDQILDRSRSEFLN